MEPFNTLEEDEAQLRFRAIFISDVHLGTPGCQAAQLLEFLRHTDSDELYLVGDIIDGWQLKRRWYWHQSHNDVIQKVLRKARKGTRVTYVAGNHDEAMRSSWVSPSAASTSATRRCTSPPTGGGSWSRTATSSTRWSRARVGSPTWATHSTCSPSRRTAGSTMRAPSWGCRTGRSRSSSSIASRTR
jgi:hypothetical protein